MTDQPDTYRRRISEFLRDIEIESIEPINPIVLVEQVARQIVSDRFDQRDGLIEISRRMEHLATLPELPSWTAEWAATRAASAVTPPNPAPIPMHLWCPKCGGRHIDEGEFATKPHHTHSCQHLGCGLTWRPAVVNTVGVEFLPGFRNAETPVGPTGLTLTERLQRNGWGEQRGAGPTSEGLGSQLNGGLTASSVGDELNSGALSPLEAIRKMLKLPPEASAQEILNRIHALQWDAFYAEEQLSKVPRSIVNGSRWKSGNPELAGTEEFETNRDWILREITDLEHAIKQAKKVLLT